MLLLEEYKFQCKDKKLVKDDALTAMVLTLRCSQIWSNLRFCDDLAPVWHTSVTSISKDLSIPGQCCKKEADSFICIRQSSTCQHVQTLSFSYYVFCKKNAVKEFNKNILQKGQLLMCI